MIEGAKKDPDMRPINLSYRDHKEEWRHMSVSITWAEEVIPKLLKRVLAVDKLIEEYNSENKSPGNDIL